MLEIKLTDLKISNIELLSSKYQIRMLDLQFYKSDDFLISRNPKYNSDLRAFSILQDLNTYLKVIFSLQAYENVSSVRSLQNNGCLITN